MLVEPERTPYDMRFRLLGFPVRVHPWFWIATVMFGSNILQVLGTEYLLAWVAVVFVSILVHELGHALAYRRFGSDADIVLYAFGGLAIASDVIAGRGRRILVSLAGPFAGFVFAGLVYASNQGTPWAMVRPMGEPWPRMPTVPDFLFDSLMFVNIAWGMVNLLPVYPLDGGQATRELCGMKWGTRGKRISLQISFAVAIMVVAYSLFCEIDTGQFGANQMAQLPAWVPRGTVYTAILFGVLAYESYRLLQRVEWTDTHWDDRLPWER